MPDKSTREGELHDAEDECKGAARAVVLHNGIKECWS